MFLQKLQKLDGRAVNGYLKRLYLFTLKLEERGKEEGEERERGKREREKGRERGREREEGGN